VRVGMQIGLITFVRLIDLYKNARGNCRQFLWVSLKRKQYFKHKCNAEANRNGQTRKYARKQMKKSLSRL
jgi:hypothetical protein